MVRPARDVWITILTFLHTSYATFTMLVATPVSHVSGSLVFERWSPLFAAVCTAAFTTQDVDPCTQRSMIEPSILSNLDADLFFSDLCLMHPLGYSVRMTSKEARGRSIISQVG